MLRRRPPIESLIQDFFLNLCSLKTSFTKWKPDFDSAASEYSKAGTFETRMLIKTSLALNIGQFTTCICLVLVFSCLF